jgi:hypothetical protein
MQVQLFGVGTKSSSPAITAQRRVNCYVDVRKEHEKTSHALIGRPGLSLFSAPSGNATRGMWAVDSLSSPLTFVVQLGVLYSINPSGIATTVGMLNTISGDVSMADDGTYLVIVDGFFGYYYNMQTAGALTVISDGNFTTTPKTVTWQDTYFIVTSSTKQFQLSTNANPAVWPSVNINFTGSGSGSLRAGMSDHSILNLFADTYTEFWQDTGSPDFPFALIPGSAQEFGLVAPFSLSKFDNSMVGLFQNKQGGVNVSRMAGFSLRRVSDSDIESILASMMNPATARGYGLQIGGHPMYVVNFATDNRTLVFDGASSIWSEWQATDGSAFWPDKFCVFQGDLIMSDRRNGNIYVMSQSVYSDNSSAIPMEVWTKHIWNDDKYIGISNMQVDMEEGTGTTTGQGAPPYMDLQVSKDGGNSFMPVGWSSFGNVGEYTQRTRWNSLGAARDWVLKLRITDPVKRVITGATCEMVGGPF